jgi:maltose O-acetyltransferase
MFPRAMSKTEYEKMLAGEPYLANHPELVAARLRARTLLRAFNDAAPDDEDGRRRSLAALLGAMGPGGWIEPPFRCDYGAQIRLGARFYANFDCVFLDCAPIEIGDDVMLGPGVHLYTATHSVDPDERASGLELARLPAKAWLGGGTIVGPGVSIGGGRHGRRRERRHARSPRPRGRRREPLPCRARAAVAVPSALRPGSGRLSPPCATPSPARNGSW